MKKLLVPNETQMVDANGRLNPAWLNFFQNIANQEEDPLDIASEADAEAGTGDGLMTAELTAAAIEALVPTPDVALPNSGVWTWAAGAWADNSLLTLSPAPSFTPLTYAAKITCASSQEGWAVGDIVLPANLYINAVKDGSTWKIKTANYVGLMNKTSGNYANEVDFSRWNLEVRLFG